jgi:hypothetical protein
MRCIDLGRAAEVRGQKRFAGQRIEMHDQGSEAFGKRSTRDIHGVCSL